MAGANVISLLASNFEAEMLRSDVPVLVDFWAPWCGPCFALGPVIDEIAAEFGDRIKVAKVNVDEAPELAARFGVRSIPNIVLFRNGTPAAQHIGLADKATLLRRLGLV